MRGRDGIVIVGAGLAGARAAQTLRAEGFTGRVALVGEESLPPYQRPPLSKEYLRGDAALAAASVHRTGWYEAHDVELLTGTKAVAIDPVARRVELSGGTTLAYDRLLLTTGLDPRRLDVPGADRQGVFHLRRAADADAIRSAAAGASCAVVVGDGWLGCEVAASLRQAGLEVSLLGLGPVPLASRLGLEVGGFFTQLHRAHGVVLYPRARVEGFDGAGGVEEVRLADGRTLPADLVVVAAGTVPRTALAEAAGVATERGILTDGLLRTSVPGIYAAGDVARALHPRYGVQLRLDHWASARDQGRLAARSMLGLAAGDHPLPYLFSEQYEVGLDYTGWVPRWDRVVLRGDPGDGCFAAFWLSKGVVGAAAAVGPVGALDEVAGAVGQPVADNALDRLTGPPAGLEPAGAGHTP